jgi:hypothetical protein
MDWLRSEDLKEEKNVTAPRVSIAGVALAGGMCQGYAGGAFARSLFPQPKQRDSAPNPTTAASDGLSSKSLDIAFK